jgi:hypothetical protein
MQEGDVKSEARIGPRRAGLCIRNQLPDVLSGILSEPTLDLKKSPLFHIFKKVNQRTEVCCGRCVLLRRGRSAWKEIL